MADILIQCAECSREYHVSEYANGNDLACGTCGAGLVIPGREGNSAGLKVREHDVATSFSFQPEAGGFPVAAGGATTASSFTGTQIVHSHVVVVKHGHHWISWIITAVVVAVLVGFQYRSEDFSQYLNFYLWSRNTLALGTYLAILFVAFQDNPGHGALCAVLPPYLLYYATSSIQSSVLRGLFYAALIVLLAETILLPEHSVFIAAGNAFNDMIDEVDALIKKASDKPILN